eukprot:Sspe_Gene.24929::Locus_9949_Transcript_1_1_Confidence_1.000_Length_951::g.24929::m.24929/K08967/mtnD, mtnZ, ADI1; 1,2-dihydroxy-3-keto-5-methylthiopentene dioxygenase
MDSAATSPNDEEIRLRDEKRKREEEQLRLRADAERKEEERREKEEIKRREEEQKRRRAEEEKWAQLGPDVIQPLPRVPPSTVEGTKGVDQSKLMQAWFLDERTSDPSYTIYSMLPGRKPRSRPVTLKELKDQGVVYWRVNLSDFSIVNQIAKERGYKHMDEIKAHQTAKDEVFLERWFAEHYHEDEEMRLVMDGGAYIDVRSKQDVWIRCHLKAGDLVVLPPGMYHRCTPDEGDYVFVMRVFQEASRWLPIYRTDRKAETLPARIAYMSSLRRGAVAAEAGFL